MVSAADAIVATSILATIAAPLAGAAIGRRARDAGRSAAGVLTLGVVAATALSAAVRWSLWDRSLGAGPILTSHLTLGAASLALTMIGALAAVCFDDVLDAAALSLSFALVAAGGLIAMGPAAGRLPTPIVNAALMASPVFAVASAANIDILRGPTLYQLSPIAHARFDYAQWYTSSALFAAVAGLAAAGSATVTKG
jgi:hypothetical protein